MKYMSACVLFHLQIFENTRTDERECLSCSFTTGPDITFLVPSAEFYLTPFIFNMLIVH